MAFDLVKITRELLKNERVAKRVAELNLSSAQVRAALSIMLTMVEEEARGLETLHYQTTIALNERQEVVRTKVLTTSGKKDAFLANITTLDYYAPNFDLNEKMRKTEERRTLVVKLSKWLKAPHDKGTKGVYLTGAQGVGKSFILKLFARKFAEANYQVAFMPSYEVINVLRQNFNIKADLIATLKAADVLFLDDIGDETIYPWSRDEVFLVVLAYRLANQKLTFFSSHFNFAELEKIEARTSGERYADATKARRLVDLIKAASEAFNLTS